MYLNIHFKKCEEQYKKYEERFNAMVKEQHPQEYRKHTLKSSHRGTYYFILRAFYKHLDDLRRTNQPLTAAFGINNCALATMQGNERSTIYRHLQRLQNRTENGKPILKDWDPMLQQKKHGRYFSLDINHKYLVADKSAEITQLVLKNRPDVVEKATTQQNDEPFLHPTFDVVFPLIVAKCNAIEIQDTLINKNIESGVCLKPNKFGQETIYKTQGSTINPQKTAPKTEKDFAGADFSKITEKDTYGNEMMPHIKRALWYLFTFLYPGQIITGEKHQKVIQFLHQFFSGSKSYWTRSELFIKLVNLQLQTLKNHPSWQQQPAWIWLDPAQKGSISATENYYLGTVLPREEKNKAWNGHRKLLEQQIIWYWKNRGVPGAYAKCKEKIGRKGKGKLLDYFHKAMIDEKSFNHQMFHELRQYYFKQ